MIVASILLTFPINWYVNLRNSFLQECLIRFDCATVSMKNFFMQCVFVLILAELEAIVFSDPIYVSVVGLIQSMLESATLLLNLVLRKRLYQLRIISINIFCSSKLSSVVYTPLEHITVPILSYQVSTTHFYVLNFVSELRL